MCRKVKRYIYWDRARGYIQKEGSEGKIRGKASRLPHLLIITPIVSTISIGFYIFNYMLISGTMQDEVENSIRQKLLLFR